MQYLGKGEDIVIDRSREAEIFECASAGSIMEKGQASGIFHHENIEYVITGTVSSGAEGLIRACAFKAIDLPLYKGDKKPLTYNEHRYAVSEGTRDRGYDCMLISADKPAGRLLVLLGPPVYFVPGQETVQANLF